MYQHDILSCQYYEESALHASCVLVPLVPAQPTLQKRTLGAWRAQDDGEEDGGTKGKRNREHGEHKGEEILYRSKAHFAWLIIIPKQLHYMKINRVCKVPYS